MDEKNIHTTRLHQAWPRRIFEEGSRQFVWPANPGDRGFLYSLWIPPWRLKIIVAYQSERVGAAEISPVGLHCLFNSGTRQPFPRRARVPTKEKAVLVPTGI
jgi:hypothetical protein